MSTVVAALEDSFTAAPVIAAASALAPLLGSTVEAVHVGGIEGSTARASAVQAGVPFRTIPGEPIPQLLALAQQDVTAVVCGSRDRLTGEAPLGHVVLALADLLPRPLLVVPPDVVPGGRVERVLVALKGTPGRVKELRYALQVVSGADVELTVIHVESVDAIPRFTDSEAHETEEFAREFLRRYWPAVPPARLVLPFGGPAEEVLTLAEDVRPDVLVAGWPQPSQGHGHVVREVLRRSRFPVLLVPLLPPTTT